MNRIILFSVAALTLAGAVKASADVLVLQDGRRISGELVSINRGTVLFDEMRQGSSSKHRMRVNKDEVVSIVLREDLARDDAADDGPFGRRDDGRSADGRTSDRRTADGRDRRGRDRSGDNGTAGTADDGPFGPDRDRGEDAPADPDLNRTDDGPFGPDRDRTPDRNGGYNRADDANTRLVTVNARQAWTDTGIDVRTGDVVRFSAEGTIQWGAGRQDGPGGEANSPMNDRRPVPGRPAGALIGRIGTSPSDVFFIGGDRAAFRIRTSGRLYLGINDDYVGDNTGAFEVRIGR